MKHSKRIERTVLELVELTQKGPANYQKIASRELLNSLDLVIDLLKNIESFVDRKNKMKSDDIIDIIKERLESYSKEIEQEADEAFRDLIG